MKTAMWNLTHQFPFCLFEQIDEGNKSESSAEVEGAVSNKPAKTENTYDMAGDTDDIYRVPPSNEPINSKIPADATVLYMVNN